MKSKALVVSIKGTKLSKLEKVLLSKEKPWGIILFKRNLRSIKQIKKLTYEIKKLTRNKKFPIIIDEEGEIVSRLKNIINHNISAKFFGDLFLKNKKFCLKLLKHYIFSLSKSLRELGININTVPVLDVLRDNTSKIIGKRSFSNNQKMLIFIHLNLRRQS